MKRTTGELLDLLKNTSSIGQYIHTSTEDFVERVPLSGYLDSLIRKKELKKSHIISQSGLDRNYAYQIFDGQKSPHRNKVLALCLSMKLSIEETQELLKYTGYTPLYAKFKTDSIILFGLEHSLSVIEINELLYEMNEPLLI